MQERPSVSRCLLLVCAACSCMLSKAQSVSPAAISRQMPKVHKSPLYFERHLRPSSLVSYSSRGHGYKVLLDQREASLLLSRGTDSGQAEVFRDTIRMRLDAVSAKPVLLGEVRQPTTVNYLFGRDPAKWGGGHRDFERVKYAGVYPGTDLVYYARTAILEFDFSLAPDADAHRSSCTSTERRSFPLIERGIS